MTDQAPSSAVSQKVRIPDFSLARPFCRSDLGLMTTTAPSPTASTTEPKRLVQGNVNITHLLANLRAAAIGSSPRQAKHIRAPNPQVTRRPKQTTDKPDSRLTCPHPSHPLSHLTKSHLAPPRTQRAKDPASKESRQEPASPFSDGQSAWGLGCETTGLEKALYALRVTTLGALLVGEGKRLVSFW